MFTKLRIISQAAEFVGKSLSCEATVMGGTQFYAVAAGHKPGIYNTWAECKAQVFKYPGAKYKKFGTSEDAEKFINQHSNNLPKGFKNLSAFVKRPNTISKSAKKDDEEPPAKRRKTILLEQPKEPISEFKTDNDGFVNVYTDGACSANGTRGAVAGFGVWFNDNHKLNVSQPMTGVQTNNRAEIQAVIVAIKQAMLAGVKNLKINTDSQFLINCITKWMPSWKRNGWKTSKNEPVVHREQLTQLEHLMTNINVCWNHVAGHAGIHGNEMADKLARDGCLKHDNTSKK